MPRPTAPSTAIQALAPKKLTIDELRDDCPRGSVSIATNHGAANIAVKRASSSLLNQWRMRTMKHLKKPLNLKKKPWRKSPNRPTTQCMHWLATPTRRR
ncbi:hypothetical protein B296_00036172 [Ensete ventricosum]|uniref:Uncharacterized protein n=1 Tax=Ensete ventricosum TaxID=4639 RepID=A0A426XU51_ENSVE|nr:hypothetical protein B296_00036172 [Ensete ventricosum]